MSELRRFIIPPKIETAIRHASAWGGISADQFLFDVERAWRQLLSEETAQKRARLAKPIRHPLTTKIGFEKYIKLKPDTGCWIWMGRLNSSGYGRISTKFYGKEKSLRAHRVAWQLYRWPIPLGLQVLHRCDVRACVNPDHLRLGTNEQNARERVQRRRRENASLNTSSNVFELRASCLSPGEVVKRCRLSQRDIAILSRSKSAKSRNIPVTEAPNASN